MKIMVFDINTGLSTIWDEYLSLIRIPCHSQELDASGNGNTAGLLYPPFPTLLMPKTTLSLLRSILAVSTSPTSMECVQKGAVVGLQTISVSRHSDPTSNRWLPDKLAVVVQCGGVNVYLCRLARSISQAPERGPIDLPDPRYEIEIAEFGQVTVLHATLYSHILVLVFVVLHWLGEARRCISGLKERPVVATSQVSI